MQHGEPSQVLVRAAAMLALFLAVVGLAIDAGTVFDARWIQNSACQNRLRSMHGDH